MLMYDFECTKCHHQFEELTVIKETKSVCPECKGDAQRIVSIPHQLHTIIPAYPGCKKQKAGYVHTHGNRPATKIQSGYGGCSSPENK